MITIRVCLLLALMSIADTAQAGEATTGAPPDTGKFIQVPVESLVVVISAAILLLAAMASFVYVWKITLDKIELTTKESHKPIIVRIMMSGAPLRSIAIVVIVITVGYLTFFGRLTSDAAAIFAGIAGYVLGAVGRGPDLFGEADSSHKGGGHGKSSVGQTTAASEGLVDPGVHQLPRS